MPVLYADAVSHIFSLHERITIILSICGSIYCQTKSLQEKVTGEETRTLEHY